MVNHSGTLFQHLHDALQLFLLIIDGSLIKFMPIVAASNFDLPGAASISNVTQYNGEFGCIICHYPGCHIKSGNGFAHVYITDVLQHQFLICENISHSLHSQTALATGVKVFGVKAPLLLLPFPCQMILDSMHCVYEGVTN